MIASLAAYSRGALARGGLAYGGLARAGLARGGLVRAGSDCLGVLLRVPRASRSTFTYAKRPGSPIPGGRRSVCNSVSGSEHPHSFLALPISHFAARGMVCLPQRSKGGARRAGDMSGGRRAMLLACSDAIYARNIPGQEKPKKNNVSEQE